MLHEGKKQTNNLCKYIKKIVGKTCGLISEKHPETIREEKIMISIDVTSKKNAFHYFRNLNKKYL